MKRNLESCFFYFGLILTFIFLFQSPVYSKSIFTEVKLSTNARLKGSTTAGNLIADAIKKETKAEIVLFPSYSGLNKNGVSIPDNTEVDFREIYNLYNYIGENRVVIVKIRGKDLKEFIVRRVKRYDNADFQVAGLKYKLITKENRIVDLNFSLANRNNLKMKKIYKVALDSYHYWYTYNLDRKIINSWITYRSEKEILRSYLAKKEKIGFKVAEERIKKGSSSSPKEDPKLEKYYHKADSKTGRRLKQALNEIIDEHKVYNYGITEKYLKKTDQVLKNSEDIVLFYSGRKKSKNSFGGQVDDWNREHIWPKSHGFSSEGEIAYSDLHNLRPTAARINSKRSNKDFANGGQAVKKAAGCRTDRDSWEPRDKVKGDVARIVFYMAVRYEGEAGNPDLELVNYTETSGSQLGKLNTLLTWHRQDPVSSREKRRNNLIYKFQGNRNPFIDHPEWVEAIW